jgi:predicted alpha-1,2-mannosidase
LLAGCSSTPAMMGPPGPIRVDPFLGTGGLGFDYASCFPGVVAPNGLAKVGPDTGSAGAYLDFLHFSGYWWGDDRVRGFSHLHLHGTGATDYGVLGVMPSDGFDAGRETASGYASHFDKKSESAAPGYYAVTLDRGGIAVELTATVHAAHHRYTFPASVGTGWVIVDLDHHLSGGSVRDADVTLFPAERRIRGRLHSIGGMSGGFGGYDVFFEIRSKNAWTHAQLWHDGAAPADGTAASGAQVGFALAFDLGAAPVVELQVGLSMVSGDGAAANLTAEMPAFDFDGTRARTAADWQALLDTLKFTGGSDAERVIFPTSVYHAFLMPSIQSDVDGSYHGQDGQVHHADGFRYVSDMSLWDTYRTVHPLYALIAPDRDADAVRSLVAMAEQAGHFSRWPIATGEAGTMVGASADVVIADAFVKGVSFDGAGAYALLRAAALDATPPPGGRGPREPAAGYMRLGYVPSTEAASGSASVTAEFARDDFALAQLARALGQAAPSGDADALLMRSIGWRQLFDPASGFIWAKDDRGNWATTHGDPTLQSSDFVEANAWQSVFAAAQDTDGLAMLFGGRDALVARIETMFESSAMDWASAGGDPSERAVPRPYYWASNEPDIHDPFLFAQVGRPELTQKWVKWAMASFYRDAPDGWPGNDDGGTMSSWYVWSALGLYPLAGSDRYVVGAPLFPHVEVKVPGGLFTIDAPGVSPDNLYVQSVMLNGAPLTAPELRHADLKAGGSLQFEMGSSPGNWGR